MLDAAPTFAFDLDRVTASLESEGYPACLVGTGGEILAVNAAWDAFARANGGAPACLGEHLLGKTYFNYIEGAGPRSYYEGVWHRVLGGLSVTVQGECNSATTLRELASSFRPVRLGAASAVVITHRVVRQREVSGAWTAPLDLALWVDEDGRLVTCSSCRCVRRADQGGWDFVPVLVQSSLAAAVHVFCPACEARLQGADRRDEYATSTAGLARRGG